MATITLREAGSTNLIAFLDMLALAEGTSISPITECDGYDIIVSGVDGRHRFDDFSTHPFEGGRAPIVVNSKGLKSDAAGRYQFMLRDWPHYRAYLDLDDFGPLSQDRWAIQLIKDRDAMPMILAGHLVAAVGRCSNIWASLPGNSYGQPQRPLGTLQTAYTNAGGNIA
jgi:muramidase (phage lysozyme)